jgi:hypothetical protein
MKKIRIQYNEDIFPIKISLHDNLQVSGQKKYKKNNKRIKLEVSFLNELINMATEKIRG